MFGPLVEPASRAISVLKQSLRLNETIRQIASDYQPNTPGVNASLSSLMAEMPALSDWRVYEHCGAVTRLYAIYERFSEELLASWLDYVPRMWPAYITLNERVRKRHRAGVAAVLSRLDHRRYEGLTDVDVVGGYSAAVSGTQPYSLLPAVFVHRESNLRFEALCQMYEDCGIGSCRSRLGRGTALTAFFTDQGEPDCPVESRLDDFVGYRNDAAHGTADEILGIDRLIYFCDLVLALMADLVEVATLECLDGLISVGDARRIGEVVEVFDRAKAVVAKVADCAIEEGDSIYFIKSQHVALMRVEEVQWHGRSVHGVIAASKVEVGLRVSKLVPRGSRLIVLRDS